VFARLGGLLGKAPALAGEVGAAVQFRVKSPDSAWVLDARQAPAAVREGTEPTAAASITIDDEDLVAWAAGETDARDLYQRGKLRVDGDVRVAQRLGFISKAS
jgi:3-hydroxyacyl-CoA dehydrogenase/3a,7a,12a-trihydroxy-5b-cholest-24-enoyl-CoA hydratase